MMDDSLLPEVRSGRHPPPRRQIRVRLPDLPRPEPLEKPTVNPDLTDLPPVERSAEVLRYQLGRTEYGLSPGGRLRAWIRFVLILFVSAGVPAALLTPIAVLVAAGLADISVSVALIARSLAGAGVSAAIIAALIGLFLLIRSGR